MTEERALVVMRLADMWRRHPEQDNSRACCECGLMVGIYPTGQRALQKHPEMKIICSRCAMSGEPGRIEPAGPVRDILQELRDSRKVQ